MVQFQVYGTLYLLTYYYCRAMLQDGALYSGVSNAAVIYDIMCMHTLLVAIRLFNNGITFLMISYSSTLIKHLM